MNTPEYAWIYLDASGLEKMAQGVEPWYWDFSLRLEEGKEPVGSALIAGLIPLNLPNQANSGVLAIEALKIKLKEARLEAHTIEADLIDRIQKLSALTWETP